MASVQTSAEIDALLHPARQYQSPAEVLADPSLTLSERRAILSGAPASLEALELPIFSRFQLLGPAVVVSGGGISHASDHGCSEEQARSLLRPQEGA
jgi:hypothetical protein